MLMPLLQYCIPDAVGSRELSTRREGVRRVREKELPEKLFSDIISAVLSVMEASAFLGNTGQNVHRHMHCDEVELWGKCCSGAGLVFVLRTGVRTW